MLSKSLPFLPGHVFNDPMKTDFKKDQIFSFKTKTCIEKPRNLETMDPDTLRSLNALTFSCIRDDENPDLLCKSTEGSITDRRKKITFQPFLPKEIPQWLKFDRKVLKFDGYFVEHVTESAHENYRIRPCDLLYYLSDDTLHIKEKKVENSGMTQGDLLKRHRAINQNAKNGEFLTWKDIKLGGEIYVYGKKFRVCKCDKFTKDFYTEKGMDIGQEEEIPTIDFSYKYKNIDFDKIKKNIAEIKEYTEVGLKGGHPNKGLKQFLENDRKVLSFDVSWFDAQYDKEEKRYKLNYYLADNQIELCEIKVNNSGKDPFPRLLRKSKLPKNPHMSYCPGLELPEDEYYKPEDLVLGNYIIVYNRKCHIIGCDDFTKKWYKDNLGIEMDSIKLKTNPPQNIIHPIPPYNGFGSEEDSMLNVMYLNPFEKVHEYVADKYKRDKHILRFNAKLISSCPSDEERKFIVSFYCRDNEIGVFENADRNSGRLPCKFIEKRKTKNPYTNKFYTEKDFVTGNVIYINKFIFKLLNCDEYTKKYMKDNSEVFKDSDIGNVITRLRSAANQNDNFDEFLVKMLKTLDPEGKDFISREEIEEGFKKFGIYLTTQELITLTDRLHMKGENTYSMEDLYNLMAGF